MHTAAAPPLLVACLCAAWCRTCDAYGPVLDQVLDLLQAQGIPVQGRWIDVEDEADLLGELDIQTFPTLVVLQGEALRFAGPVTPQPETLQRLLKSLLEGGGAVAAEPAVADLTQRLLQDLRR